MLLLYGITSLRQINYRPCSCMIFVEKMEEIKYHYFMIRWHVVEFSDNAYSLIAITGLPWSGKKFCKMKIFPGQGKVREFHFQSGKFIINEKSRNFKIFQKSY